MTTTELENRIVSLEKELGLLKSKFEKIEKEKEPWWKKRTGSFANDPIYEEVVRLGREYRESQREDYNED